MKNKILLLSIILSIGVITATTAQQKPLDVSLKIYGGYGFLQTDGELLPFLLDNKTKNGLGIGGHFGAGMSLKLGDLVSVGLDADYLTGKSRSSYFVYSNINDMSTNAGYQGSKHSVFSLIPNVTFKLWSNTEYKIYNTLGVIMALNPKIDFTQTGSNHYTSTGTSDNVVLDRNYKFGFSAGVKDAFGMQLRLAKNVRCFAEVFGYFLAASPHSQTFTFTLTAPGQGSTVTTIVNNYKPSGNINIILFPVTTTAGVTYSGFSQDSLPEFSEYFNSIGINAGIIIDLKK